MCSIARFYPVIRSASTFAAPSRAFFVENLIDLAILIPELSWFRMQSGKVKMLGVVFRVIRRSDAG
ncbi:MAG: hypothetical protein BroJett021_23600 [Chloroflexota bacterium]|nr:MAG: hypothetical protein BroJett021_23600 [Chloroflexota bacterium]